MMTKLNFKPRARLLLQLGNELIKNESIAVLELVKNSYDADASRLVINMEKIDSQDEGTISIEDDGDGMNLETIENVWMELGTSNKIDNEKYTKKFKRRMLGEKGIGRFAVHKLGNVIELTTKKRDNKEVFLKIDWTIFEKSRYLTDSSIDIIERQPEVFTEDKTGTRIVIKKLRKPWTRGMLRELVRSWNTLSSPVEPTKSFKMELETNKSDWEKGIKKFDDITDMALFRFVCKIYDNKIIEFQYNFQPYATMTKLRPREVTDEDSNIQKLLEVDKPIDNKHDKGDDGIGEIEFKGFIFDRDPKILTLGLQDKEGIKKYLDKNGGIKVYKDGIRVYGYGEKDDDWLDLDVKRVNNPTMRISKNILVGFVSISREKSWDLIEKTNREGFISNFSYEKFANSIKYALHLVELQRYQDKNLIRNYYGPTPHHEPIIATINELKDIVKKKVSKKSTRDEITIKLEKIGKKYNDINEVLLKAAGAGLSLSVVLHEVDKIITELISRVKNNHYDGVLQLIEHLSKLVDGYTFLIRNDGKKKLNVQDMIERSLFNVKYRLQLHDIELVLEGMNLAKKSIIKGSSSLIISSIMNIIDNSIYWLDYAKIEKKKILVYCSNKYDGYISIIIADNGLGFSLLPETMIKPFVSAKKDGSGLGLHIVNETMIMHEGQLLFPENKDFLMKKEFRSGGVVCLTFKMEDAD